MKACEFGEGRFSLPTKEYYQANRPKVLASNKKYRDARIAEIKAWRDRDYADNLAKYHAKQKEWRLGHLELKRERDREYRLGHRDELAAKRKAQYDSHLEEWREYRKVNRDKRNAQSQVWKAAHQEEIRAYNAAHQNEHREYAKRHAKEHAEEYKERLRAWRKSHPDAKAAQWQRHRARKVGLPHTLTKEEWRSIKEAYKGRCAYCGKRGKLTQDHVIPLSKGGGTVRDNIVPACRSCNSSKNDSPPRKALQLVLV